MSAGALGSALRAAADLVLTRHCAGCGVEATRWCGACAIALDDSPVPRQLADGTWVWSAAPYEGVVREAVNAWKDRDRPDITDHLAVAVAAAYVRGALDGHVLVPVPSSAAARRRRGRVPVDDLARGAARRLRRDGYAVVPVWPLLRLRRRVADQSGLGALARAENVAAAMHVPGRVGSRAAGTGVVLVDDVVTSGATLLEAARALRAGGATVVGAVTLAATQRHHTQRHHTQRHHTQRHQPGGGG